MVIWAGVQGVFPVIAVGKGEGTFFLVGQQQGVFSVEGIRIAYLQHAHGAKQGQDMLGGIDSVAVKQNAHQGTAAEEQGSGKHVAAGDLPGFLSAVSEKKLGRMNRGGGTEGLDGLDRTQQAQQGRSRQEELRREMAEAVLREDFEQAAALRDQLRSLEQGVNG